MGHVAIGAAVATSSGVKPADLRGRSKSGRKVSAISKLVFHLSISLVLDTILDTLRQPFVGFVLVTVLQA